MMRSLTKVCYSHTHNKTVGCEIAFFLDIQKVNYYSVLLPIMIMYLWYTSALYKNITDSQTCEENQRLRNFDNDTVETGHSRVYIQSATAA